MKIELVNGPKDGEIIETSPEQIHYIVKSILPTGEEVKPDRWLLYSKDKYKDGVFYFAKYLKHDNLEVTNDEPKAV